MTRPYIIIRLILSAMGVNLLMRSLNSVYSAVLRLNHQCPQETFIASMAVITAGGVFTFTMSLILLFRSNCLARLVVGPDADQCEKANCTWTIAAFRMTACFCGLLILYYRIRLLFYYVPAFIKGPILSYLTLEGQSSQLSAEALARILVEAAKWIFAIYLIFGAPHFASRQMRAIAVKTRGEK